MRLSAYVQPESSSIHKADRSAKKNFSELPMNIVGEKNEIIFVFWGDFLCITFHYRKRNCCHWVNDVLVSSGCNGAESYFPGYSLPSHPAPVAP